MSIRLGQDIEDACVVRSLTAEFSRQDAKHVAVGIRGVRTVSLRDAPPAQHRFTGKLIEREAVRIDPAVCINCCRYRPDQFPAVFANWPSPIGGIDVPSAANTPSRVPEALCGVNSDDDSHTNCHRRDRRYSDCSRGNRQSYATRLHTILDAGRRAAATSSIRGIEYLHGMIRRDLATHTVYHVQVAQRCIDPDKKLDATAKILCERRLDRISDGRSQNRWHDDSEVEGLLEFPNRLSDIALEEG